MKIKRYQKLTHIKYVLKVVWGIFKGFRNLTRNF